MKIEWTEPAVLDLESIHNYIAKDSKYYASRFVIRIIEAVEGLEKFPEKGRLVPEAEKEKIREIIFYNYRIIYCKETERILILAIIHSSRDLSKKKLKPWDVI